MSTAQTIEAKLIAKKQLTDDVIELQFESTPAFDFAPGQFVSLIVAGAGPGGRDLRRAYSIASEPEKKILNRPVFELCIKLVENGPGTHYLNKLNLGDTMKAMAPYGNFVFKPKPGRAAMMIATGTGIAPFRSMIFSNIFNTNLPTETTLLFGARHEKDLLYTDECREKLKNGFIQALSRPSGEWPIHQGGDFKGRVTDYLRHQAAKIKWTETEFYLCGNGAMIDEVKQILSNHGVEKASIHQEVYYKPKPGETHASQ